VLSRDGAETHIGIETRAVRTVDLALDPVATEQKPTSGLKHRLELVEAGIGRVATEQKPTSGLKQASSLARSAWDDRRDGAETHIGIETSDRGRDQAVRGVATEQKPTSGLKLSASAIISSTMETSRRSRNPHRD